MILQKKLQLVVSTKTYFFFRHKRSVVAGSCQVRSPGLHSWAARFTLWAEVPISVQKFFFTQVFVKKTPDRTTMGTTRPLTRDVTLLYLAEIAANSADAVEGPNGGGGGQT